MEQPNKPYGFPAREILIPALKVGALSGEPIFQIWAPYAIVYILYVSSSSILPL